MAIEKQERFLIVNADDFGQSSGVNRGIMKAHDRGIVTSSSLMVRWPAAAEAAAYGRRRAEFSLGLHLDLGEWAFRHGNWVRLYDVVPEDDETAVEAEVFRQLSAFRHLVGKNPTHLDSHQHVHLREPVRSIIRQIAQELEIPLRQCSPDVQYCGCFYGQTEKGSPYPEGITVDGLIGILKELPPGFTELGCHPGLGGDLRTMYRQERAQEVKVLCDPGLRQAISKMGIVLCSFRDVVPRGASLGRETRS